MSEPNISSAVSTLTALGFSFVGVLSSAHPTAMWGAMIGSIVCILTYNDTSPLVKIGYFLLSWVLLVHIRSTLFFRGKIFHGRRF